MPSQLQPSPDSPVHLPRVARARIAVGFAVVVVLVAVAGFVAGALVPRSQAAKGLDETGTATVSAVVESRVVQTQTSLQATIKPGERIEVSYAPSSEGDVIPYVTAVGPSPGQQLLSGSLLLAIADSPRVALKVDSPLYRSLRVGDVGRDVLAFETALAQHVGGDYDVDETFTESTMIAAEALWDRLGYELPTEEKDVPIAPVAPSSSTPGPTATAQSEPVRYSYVDVYEIVQISSDSATVIENSTVGELAKPDSPVAVVAGADSYIGARVSLLDEAKFAVGTPLKVSTAGRTDSEAVVSELGDFEISGDGDQGTEGAGRDAVISVPPGWEDLAEGTIVQVSPTATGEPVLAVPLTALRDAATAPYVVVENAVHHDPGSHVPVSVLSTGDGWVEIDESAGLLVGDAIRLTP